MPSIRNKARDQLKFGPGFLCGRRSAAWNFRRLAHNPEREPKLKLKKARRYEIDGLTIDIPESPTHPGEIKFLQWANGLKWQRIFILTSNCN